MNVLHRLNHIVHVAYIQSNRHLVMHNIQCLALLQNQHFAHFTPLASCKTTYFYRLGVNTEVIFTAINMIGHNFQIRKNEELDHDGEYFLVY